MPSPPLEIKRYKPGSTTTAHGFERFYTKRSLQINLGCLVNSRPQLIRAIYLNKEVSGLFNTRIEVLAAQHLFLFVMALLHTTGAHLSLS